jgi:hypothetical protein
MDKLDKLRELDSKINNYSIPLVRKRDNDEVDDLNDKMEEVEIKEEKKPIVDDDGFMMVTKKDKKKE